MKTTKYILTLIAVMMLTALNAWGAITPSTPSKDASGVYQISTAAELWGFANLVNSTSGTNIALNAKLTDNIELPAEDFPMIGVYNTKKYAGTFDGDGHTISGLQISSTATGIGLFRTTYGATIKNFKLSGTITVTNGTSSSYFIASVVGFADNNTKIEDVSSSVNITFNGGAGGTSGVRIVGGIAGRVKGTLNRCRYNGTIDASNASAIGDRLAGICAEGNATLNITNCLFDGTIKTACTATGNNHRVGGVVAFSNGATVKVDNCLSTGSYEFAATASLDNCGIVSGVSNAATCTNTYYTTTTNLYRSGVTNGGVTAVDTTPWSTITDNLNGGASVTACNWKVVTGPEYPIPMAWTKSLYTITFDAQGGNDVDAVTDENNTEITLPTAVKTGYRFDGWNTKSDGTGTAYARGAKYTITADATLYAQYTINQYTITFNTDGGSAVASITQDYNTAVTKPANPTKTGYTFAGWDKEIPSTMPAESTTITATWTINQYTITFNTDGGSAVAPITQDYNTAVTKPANPTKTGYTFAGWDKEIPSTMPAESTTITATWTINSHTITFDTKGGTAIAPITQDYGTTITAPANPEKAHYRFDGWDKTIPATMPDEDMTITATYTYVPNAENVYEIGSKEDFFNFVTIASTNASANAMLVDNIDLQEEAFNGFGTSTTGYKGTFDGNKKTISGYKRTFTSGNNSLGFFYKTEGATIKDFTLEGEEIYDINTACYAIGGVIGMANNTTIEGVTSKVNMTFGANCPSGASGIRCVGGITGRISGGSINKCRYNGTIDLSANSGICDRFGGIVGDLGAASTISNSLFDGEIKVAATTSLAMGGILGTNNSKDATIQHCLFNGKMTFPAGANVSNCGPISGGTGVTASDSYYDMTGFTVGGVKQAKTAVQQSSSNERTTQPWLDICVALNNNSTNWGIQSKEYPVPGETAPANHTITFNTVGGSEIAAITLPTGASITAPANPTKTGYTFTGWDKTIPTTMPDEDVTITAKWSINQYTITFNTDGGSTVASITQDYNTAITKPADPTKTGYTFAGWSEAIPSTMPAESITITAAWTINQYTIKFDTDGGSAVASITQDYNTAVTKPADPTKIGYDFAGWKDANGNDATVPTTMPAGSITLTAKWNVISYKLTYKVDGALYKEYNVDYGTEITPEANPTKARYTFSGWSEIPSTMPAHDVTVTGTFTYTANASGVYEIGNREDYVNFVAVTKTTPSASAKLIDNIDLNNEAVDCIGTSTSKYTGTFDGQGYTIKNYSRTTTSGDYSGMFGAVENATVKNFKINGSVTISTTGSQQHGSVIGVSVGTSTLIEDVWSSVDVNITGTAAQVGGFVGRAGGTYNRCRYSGTVTTSTAHDKIGGFASNLREGTIKNCLFDGTLSVSSNNESLAAGGFAAAVIEVASSLEGCLSHGTINITNKTAKCGIVIGLVDRNTTIKKIYYTTTSTNGLTAPIGLVSSSYTLTGTAKDATSMTWANVCEGLNPMSGTEGNWKIETDEGAKEYPIPAACQHTHTHQWNNGICPFDDERQPIEEVSGAYEIGNLGQFLNFVDLVKTTPTANARITNNFSIANSGFEAIGTYKGTFDGQGHTISGYSRNLMTNTTAGTGFFNKTDGATIKEVKFEGSLAITGENKSAFIGSIVGIATNTTFEDVTSSISMSSAATVDGTQSNGLRILGGLVGALRGGSMSRCRYNGEMTFNAKTDVIGDRFGGLVGWQQTNASTITNCLFDGTMTVQKNSIYIGGIVGQGLNGSTIKNSLFAGTITQTLGNVNCGPIIGFTNGTSVSDTYYDLNGFNYTTAYNNAGTAKGTTTWTAVHQALGTANWVTEDGKAYPVPGEQNATHSHNYENGFCTSLVGVCDARKEVPSVDEATGTYKIANVGQLFSFAEKYNDGTYAENCKAELIAAIDMDGDSHGQFPGIGTQAKPFKGTFNGAGKAITEFARTIGDQNGQGFFNYVDGATIKNFSIAGTLDINSTVEHYYFGSVAGKITGTTTLEDITSTVIINLNGGKEKAVGGIVGIHDGASVINRCRYKGTINAKNSYNNIGGIAGEENSSEEGGLNNTLFDGTISFNNDNTNEIIVGGLVGFLNRSDTKINNCLSHGTITLPTGTHAKAGAVIGYAKDKKINLTRVLYTSCGSVTVAMGTGCTGCTLNANPSYIPLDITVTAENTKLYDGVALAMLGEANWKQDGTTATDYPYPGIGGATHTHSYNSNGFCIAEDGNYEPATKAQDGYYEIDNAGKLWWIAQQLKDGNLAKNIRIKLSGDIDMEGDKHGSFPGICPLGSKQVDGQNVDDWETAFQGIFDGQGKTISNYYRKQQSGLRQGLFNVIYNGAQVKNFNINGEMIVAGGNTTCALMGVVVGVARGTSTIEDINSSVNITAAGSRGVGGIVGCLENTNNQPLTKLNRCRYNGTITVSSTNMNDGIGGIAGEIRSAIMTNVLFDGQIVVKSGTTYKYIGGITGVVRNSDNSEIHRALSHGTIKLEGGNVTNTIVDNTTTGGKEVQGSLTGIYIGGIYKTLYLNKCYHTTTGATTGIPVIGPQIHEDKEKVDGKEKTTHTFVNDLLLGSSTDITTTATIENEDVHIYDHKFHTTLGESNWAIVEYTKDNYPKPKKDATHNHYYVNGFCTAGDGEYEKATVSGTSYIIDNGGKLYWFAEHFNNPGLDGITIPQDATVELKKTSTDENATKVIDMEGDKYIFPGIGSQSRPFMGTFTGHGFTIKKFIRDIVNSENTGLINYSMNAEIREFQLEGQINYNLNAAKSFHGTVVGYAAGEETLIEDVFSFVQVRMNNNHTRVWGGIAGRASGRIHCCRYSGIVAKSVTSTSTGENTATTTIEAMASGEQIGGICGNAQSGLIIEDCLFDGTIKSYCYDRQMRVAGILASNELRSQVTIQIKNCLFNGCLDLQHLYEGENKETKNGIIAGYWDTNKASLINNVYYLKKCATEMESLVAGNYGTTPQKNDVTQIQGEPTEQGWSDIFDSLDEKDPETNPQGNGNWTHGTKTEEGYPTPGGNICNHKNADGSSAFNEFGYCTICGEAKELKQDEDGKYIMEAISDLAGFRDLINSGTNGSDEFNAKMTEDIDFANWEGDFGEPIGNSHFNRYLYNFDGQGHKLLNVKITTTDEYVGFFGFAGDNSHDCYIHDFTITGEIEVPYDSKLNDNKPLYMGVVGKMYRGTIENVHSELVMKNENPTRAVIGGILGAAETADKAHPVTITKCSYTGTCEANAVGNMGGIIGETSKGTVVDHCTFAGTMDHVYDGENNSTSFGGIVGYNEDADFSGVQNCIIAGVLKTGEGREFKDYGETGNHKNVLCGEDAYMNSLSDKVEYAKRYSGNYAWDAYSASGLLPANSIVYPSWIEMEKINKGGLCAIMNAQETPDYVEAKGYPWGQVLGYQVGVSDGKGGTVRHFTEGSPAMRVPLPGYQLPDKKTYAVTAVTNSADETKKDYTAGWYYFDDQGDSTPFPTDAASLKVKKIEYHRAAEHLTGYNSFCLPFEFTQDMANSIDDTHAAIYKYSSVDETNKQVMFTPYTNEEKVPAGKPFILYANKDEEWKYIKEDADGITIPMNVTNPASGAAGLYGSFNTILTGEGFYKLTPVGDHFVKTVKEGDTDHTSASHCYPYRAYLKIGSTNGAKNRAYMPVFLGVDEQISGGDSNYGEDDRYYNTMGQRVNADTKGIVIVNGKKYFNR